jgi:hypothetical protein
MQRRIKLFSRFQDTKSHMNEFSHHGTDDDHRTLPRGSQPSTEFFSPLGFVKCHHRRHVQRFAQKSMAYLGHSGFAPDTTARLMLTRIKSSKSNGLPRISETVGLRIKSQQNGNGAFAQPWNTVKQLLLVMYRLSDKQLPF